MNDGHKESILLIGFMGSGKSTLGKLLSSRLFLPFMDTDAQIETEQKKSITDIFAQDGEEAFRRMETQVLRSLGDSRMRRVISTGGGLPMREENRALLKRAGRVVFLRIRPDTVYERLREDNTRPLLQKEDPEAEIRRLLAVRNPLYEEAADLIVDVDGKAPEELAEELLVKLKGEMRQ